MSPTGSIGVLHRFGVAFWLAYSVVALPGCDNGDQEQKATPNAATTIHRADFGDSPPPGFVKAETRPGGPAEYFDPSIYRLPVELDKGRHLVVVNSWTGGRQTDIDATAFDCRAGEFATIWADGKTVDPFKKAPVGSMVELDLQRACAQSGRENLLEREPPVVVATADDLYRCGGNFTGWSIEDANVALRKLGCPLFKQRVVEGKEIERADGEAKAPPPVGAIPATFVGWNEGVRIYLYESSPNMQDDHGSRVIGGLLVEGEKMEPDSGIVVSCRLKEVGVVKTYPGSRHKEGEMIEGKLREDLVELCGR